MAINSCYDFGVGAVTDNILLKWQSNRTGIRKTKLTIPGSKKQCSGYKERCFPPRFVCLMKLKNQAIERLDQTNVRRAMQLIYLAENVLSSLTVLVKYH